MLESSPKDKRVCFQYEDGDDVVLRMGGVGRHKEWHLYYSLPFCRGTKIIINHYNGTLAEALQGIELKFSGLDIEFKGRHSYDQYMFILVHDA